MHTALARAGPDGLLHLWRRQIALPQQTRSACRRAVAVGYLCKSPVFEGLIDVEKLVLTVLHGSRRDEVGIRFAGFAASRTAWGVQWGSTLLNRFEKDLSLTPGAGVTGPQLDLMRPALLQHALQLERHRHSAFVRLQPHLRLPRLWAAFERSKALTLFGDGPELEAFAGRMGRSQGRLFQEGRREHEQFLLWPLEWTSHHWPEMELILADLQGFPKRQAFVARNLPSALQGYRGAVRYDFWSSRFRTTRLAR